MGKNKAFEGFVVGTWADGGGGYPVVPPEILQTVPIFKQNTGHFGAIAPICLAPTFIFYFSVASMYGHVPTSNIVI